MTLQQTRTEITHHKKKPDTNIVLQYVTPQAFLIGEAGALYLQYMLKVLLFTGDPILHVTLYSLYKLLQTFRILSWRKSSKGY